MDNIDREVVWNEVFEVWNTLFWFIRALTVILILVTITIIIIIILKNSIGGIF